MAMFSSDYENAMFMRFIDGFWDEVMRGNLVNPYELFCQESSLFPYPPIMFLIECIGGGIARLAGDNLVLKNMFFKLPNLFFDCLGMFYLLRLFPEKRKYIAILYFASPIILYSTYMHGQLDIIPTVFLIGALTNLTLPKQRNTTKYMCFLFAALGSKLHIVAVVPILMIFIMKRDGWKQAIILSVIPFVLLVLCIIPFWGEGFLYNVLLNNEQTVLTKIYIKYVDIKIYIPILAVVLMYLKVYTVNKINKELLYSFCGILFAIFLVLVPPMPGWYVWVVPFITIYFIDIQAEKYLNLVIYALLNLAYIFYFIFAHQTEYVDLYYFQQNLSSVKIANPVIINCSFTLLTAFLIYSIYMMYQSGVASNSLYKRKNRPFTIGVSGDSGSGKSTFILMAEKVFGKKNLLYIEGDGDHKWERGNAMWEHFTHLNPKSNFLYRQAKDLEDLRSGLSVMRADYDHDTGKFTEKIKIRPKPYILLCGLHALYLPQIRRNLDLKIYMDIDENLRRYWKIERDTAKRGYSKEKIIKQISERELDVQKYIYPQKRYADLIICYFDKHLTSYLIDNHRVQLSLKVTLSADIDLEMLIQVTEKYGIAVEYDYDEDLKTQSVVFSGEQLESEAPTLPFAEIAESMIPQLDEIIDHPLEASDDMHGILEIILLLLISKKLQGDDL